MPGRDAFPTRSNPAHLPPAAHLGCTKAGGFNANIIAWVSNTLYHMFLWFGGGVWGWTSLTQPVSIYNLFTKLLEGFFLAPRYFCSLSKGTALQHPGPGAGAALLGRQ